MIEHMGKLMNHRKGPDHELTLSESEAPTIAIWLLMAIICYCGSVLPLKDTSDGGLKFSRT